MASSNPNRIEQPAHWLEALLLPGYGWGDVGAVHTLLSTRTAEIPKEYPANPRPLLEGLLRGSDPARAWEFFAWVGKSARWPARRDGQPLPLAPNELWPATPALPGPSGQIPKGVDPDAYLQPHEAVFARLLAAGADPWMEVQLPDGPADGFDLACAWCSASLMEACLRHPNRPALETLHRRNPWRLRPAPGWETKAGDLIFSSNDTLVHAFSATGAIDALRLVLAHGWVAEPNTGGRAPMEVAASAKVVEELLKAGAAWKDSYTDTWNRMASHHHALSTTLIARLKTVTPHEKPEVAAERMARLAVKAVREDNHQDLQRALAFFNPEVGKDKYRHVTFDLEEAKAWLAMPEVSMAQSGQGKKAHPLYHICRRSIRDGSRGGKQLIKAAYIFGAAVQVDPMMEIARGSTVRGMAHLFLARIGARSKDKITQERLEKVLAEHGRKGDASVLFGEILRCRETVTKGSVANASREVQRQTEIYLRNQFPVAFEEERFQLMTEHLDCFKGGRLWDDASLPDEDWLDKQPLQVRVEWSTALAGSSHSRTLKDQIETICERLANTPQDEGLDTFLQELEEQIRENPRDRDQAEILATRVSEARLEWALPQASPKPPRAWRF